MVPALRTPFNRFWEETRPFIYWLMLTNIIYYSKKKKKNQPRGVGAKDNFQIFNRFWQETRPFISLLASHVGLLLLSAQNAKLLKADSFVKPPGFAPSVLHGPVMNSEKVTIHCPYGKNNLFFPPLLSHLFFRIFLIYSQSLKSVSSLVAKLCC